jgi:hypothetical protein
VRPDDNGTLDVDLLDGFSPSAGQSYDILYGSTTGSFAQMNLPALSNGLQWDTSNLDTTGTISVTPEPSTLVLLVAASLGWLGYSLQRRSASTRTAKPADFDQARGDGLPILSVEYCRSAQKSCR